MRRDERFDARGMPLLLHIGSGAGSDADLCANADTVVLVEPDPQLAQKARVWLSEVSKGRVVQAAVADSVGHAAFDCVSYSKMSSSRSMTGALNLYPGLKVFRGERVATVRPRDLLQEYKSEIRKGGCGLIVGAPSEAHLVLSDLHASGLLGGFDYIQIDVGEDPLHAGGACKASCETWARDNNYSVQWGRSASDPNLHVGRLNYDWSAAYRILNESYLKERKYRESLEEDLKRLQSQTQDELQKNQKLTSEVEDLREDNRLSLRMQRMAQADLADLQSRFMALTVEKSRLEDSLDKISSYMRSEISYRMEMEVNTRKAKKKAKRVTSKERPVSKSGESSDG